MQATKPAALIDLSLIRLVFFIAALAILAIAVAAGFYRGLTFLPWAVLCWLIGMLGPVGSSNRRFRWLGWSIPGAIALYVGIYLAFMSSPSLSVQSDTKHLPGNPARR
ncbi:MAG: hypothetical protein AUJ51_08410 [Elusimicrobia bacterium CG1_02_56_21]|nr:MAG: hypothetical protein AUJ51_08410 [Elusimicrobia bacterium CG1_02_56_21]